MPYRVPFLLRQLTEQWGHAIRRFYYRFVYGYRRPGGQWLTYVVRWMEHRWDLRDVPVRRSKWENDYVSGRWSYMSEVEEAPRYAVIAGYLRVLAYGGHYLDVGCGEGVLLRHLDGEQFDSYLGVDISISAISRAHWHDNGDVRFAVADAESLVVDRRYDAIVLNEVLYYMRRPLEIARRYWSMLNPEGVMIVSSYHGSPRAMAILRHLKDTFFLKAESTTSAAGNTWTCSVFRSGSALGKVPPP